MKRLYAGLAAFMLMAILIAAGPIVTKLDEAKAEHGRARRAASDALAAAIEAEAKSRGAAGDLEAVQSLSTARDAFRASDKLPEHASLKSAVSLYLQAKTSADTALVKAYDRAINESRRARRGDQAASLREERAKFVAASGVAAPATEAEDAGDAASTAADTGTPPAATMPTTAPVPAPGEAGTLAEAKAAHAKAIDNARKTLLTTLDSRLQGATARGDLDAVKTLDAWKAVVVAQGILKEEPSDPAVRAANVRAQAMIATANAALGRAYEAAVREATRVGDRARAESLRIEARAKGLLDAPAAGAAGSTAGGDAALGAFLRLGGHANLPPYFAGNDTLLAEKEGLRFSKFSNVDYGAVRTKDGDFLKRDFVFDVVFTLAADEYVAWIGMGEGANRGPGSTPYNFVRFEVHAPDRDDGKVVLQKWVAGGDAVGNLRNAGTHLARIEKHGPTVTLSLVQDFKGKFEPTIQKTLPNVLDFQPKLKDGQTFLFFGGGALFQQVRLTVLPTGSSSSVTPAGVGR